MLINSIDLDRTILFADSCSYSVQFCVDANSGAKTPNPFESTITCEAITFQFECPRLEQSVVFWLIIIILSGRCPRSPRHRVATSTVEAGHRPQAGRTPVVHQTMKLLDMEKNASQPESFNKRTHEIGLSETGAAVWEHDALPAQDLRRFKD